MAKIPPSHHNLIFPLRSRISSRSSRKNRNYVKLTPSSLPREYTSTSEFKFDRLKNQDAHSVISSLPSLVRFSRSCLVPAPPFLSPFLSVRTMSQSGDSISLSDSTKTVRCVIKGRVQGVFYRNWTIENATQLGLKGWVRNKRDGSVEALFSGKPESVDEMQQRCRRGPPDAMVTGFQAFPCNDDPGTGFERKPTV